MSHHSTVVILDYGSQYTQLIARRVRDQGIYSIVFPGGTAKSRWEGLNPRAIILSGGPASVYDPGAPDLDPGFLDYVSEKKIPVLGICYGMQLLVHRMNGEIKKAHVREYGRMGVKRTANSTSYILKQESTFQAWMSHGDEAVKLPAGFEITAKSESGALAAIECPEKQMYALQFHPEVTHTEGGSEILKRFLVDVAKIKPDWTMQSVREEQIEKIRARVKPEQHVICALSGGVDSAVAAALVHEAIGDRLHCVFVDHGLLRFDEQARVMKLFQETLHLKVECVDASEKFLSELAGVVDPEKKRKIIGAGFIRVFDDYAEKLSKGLGHLPEFLVQGTLYPDVIESSPAPQDATAGAGVSQHAAKIKSHHNVGGLPKNLRFQLIEPLRDLFKDEVRALGRTLGVPENFIQRHPFPGPGLAVRIVGDITREAIGILQKADEIYIQEIRDAGLYPKIWQAFAVFLPIRTVGVQGDGRTHDHVIALRAVTSQDGMTADWYDFEASFLRKVSSRICNEVRGVNRVVYDISSKPPATIEWE